MSEAECSNKPTILDYLNEDCWQAVLVYVPVKDIIQSERVSRRWQTQVLVYLRRIRIGIENRCFNVSGGLRNVSKVILSRQTDCYTSFNSWTNKLGPSVVATYCDNENSLKVIGENCPNLEALTIMNIPEVHLTRNKYENFRWLQRICFKRCGYIRDRCISKFISHKTLQELEIHNCDGVTGQCLLNLTSTNLKTLVFKYCSCLIPLQLLRAANLLSEVTRFELVSNRDLCKYMHVLLSKMPKLKHLTINNSNIMADNVFESVSQLGSLKSLNVNLNITDEHLEAVVRSCTELRALILANCFGVTGQGLAVACALAGARLTELGVSRSEHLTDDDVVGCIRACPNLKSLSVTCCLRLTCGLPARAAAARREVRAQGPLVLHTLGTELRNCDPQELAGLEGLFVRL